MAPLRVGVAGRIRVDHHDCVELSRLRREGDLRQLLRLCDGEQIAVVRLLAVREGDVRIVRRCAGDTVRYDLMGSEDGLRTAAAATV